MKHKILCIDDEKHNLEALERLLRKSYDIVLAESGAEALKTLEDHQFSLIISDQKMPEMTGVEFLKKAIDHQPDAIRILLTGYTDLESVIGAINQGQIYRYVTKPWDPEELQGIVQQAIDVFQMKKTINEQNEQLVKANEELKSLDRMKTDFMLLVNHELKTPLTAIFSFTELLKEEDLADDHKLYVNKISKNTSRLQNLINDTLLITRLKSDLKQIERKSSDIKLLIQKQWDKTEKEHPKKSLTLDLKSSDGFEQNINEEFITITLNKIIQNSFTHAKPDTSVSIELSENNTHWILQTENQIVKKIERTPEQLLNSFSRDEDILNHSGGAGLGLAVIQAVVQLFSAQIEIDFDDQKFSLKISFPKKLTF
ncbi:MAG: hybrid sensor histidine kinase/response regulator [Bdellovibrionales bacterium]|nr:hybrid sensor histidine kinase/response regulator [Bdellovibrionales bacterium]NQZ18342.1 hybrid sensor histidine kinase/response regulator [Bdellovibrionales bacterium]